MANDYNKSQESIVRQSTLKFVNDYCKIKNVPLKLIEVIALTNILTEYCQEGYTKDLGKKIKEIDNYIEANYTK